MRILCVHDDPNALERLRRLLLEREHDWQVRLERTTRAGIDAFHSWCPDAIVAAVHPPAVDGIELLMHVRDAHSETIRIAMGDAQMSDTTMRSLKIAHRVVPEDVGPNDLVESMRRALLLRDIVSPAPLRKLLGQVGTLPAVPRVYAELTRRLEDPSVSVFELSELVAEDATLAAQVLRMSNSAYFGRDRAVTRLLDAAARLGTRLLRSLVLSAEVYGPFPVTAAYTARLEDLQRHAALVARIASSLEPRAPWTDDAFAAGLVHDIGKLVLMSRIPEQYAAIEREAIDDGRELHELEAQHLGANHGTVGACLLGMWGLPSVILEAVHGHHGLALDVPQKLNSVRAVALADRLAHDVTDTEESRERRPALPVALVTDPRWNWWHEMAEQMAMDGMTV